MDCKAIGLRILHHPEKELQLNYMTVLLPTKHQKGNIGTNFRPITCLPLMWKLFTGIMGDELYKHLEEENLLPDEQKGCRRNSRGTKDQLLIDKMVIRNCKRRKSGLGMAWLEYKKAYDMIPCVYECLELLKMWSCCWNEV